MYDSLTVTKDNFRNCLEEFEFLIKNKSFKYIIINNEISTFNPKIIEKEGEIVFTEFTICSYVNERPKFKTFFIPSIKYHRYSEDEIASFNSLFLNNLLNEKNIYSLKDIYKSNSLSYENINKKEKLEKNLNAILKDGKPFTEENKKSYNYFPKAVVIPSKKFQRQFENILKYFVEKNDEIKEKVKDSENQIYLLETNLFEDNYILVNKILNFRWNLIYENFDNDTFKLYVDGCKIKKLITKKAIKLTHLKHFKEFIKQLTEFILDGEKISEKFKVLIKEKGFDKNLFENWKKYLISEGLNLNNISETDNNKIIEFELIKEKNKDKKNNFNNFIQFLIFIEDIMKDFEIKPEFILENIIYKKINIRNLLPKKIRDNIVILYHINSKINKNNFRLLKKKEEYLSKISYKKLLITNKSDEEILFGFKIEPHLRDLFKIKSKDKKQDNQNSINRDITNQISKEFSNVLEILLKNEEFKKIFEIFFSQFSISSQDEKFNIVRYILNKIPEDNNFEEDFQTLLNKAKEVKKNNLLMEEIGVTYFYKILFNIKNINIYGANLKNKIYYPIRKLLLDENKDNENEIKNVLNRVNIYDLSYICMEKNIDFYNQYLKIQNDKKSKDLSITQKLGFIIQNNEILENVSELKEYKNKFYTEENEKKENKLYINIKKRNLYKKSEEIIDLLKDNTDFTVNKDIYNNRLYKINFIDPEKFKDINNISNQINNI